jgi:hypothetical protein
MLHLQDTPPQPEAHLQVPFPATPSKQLPRPKLELQSVPGQAILQEGPAKLVLQVQVREFVAEVVPFTQGVSQNVPLQPETHRSQLGPLNRREHLHVPSSLHVPP